MLSIRLMIAGMGGAQFARAHLFVAAVLLSLSVPVLAQSVRPQVWTTNVVPGEFSSQKAALAAVQAQGGAYALAELVESVVQTEALTAFVYGARPRGVDVGPYYKFSISGCQNNPKGSEADVIQCVNEYWSRLQVCPPASTVPATAWVPWYIYYDGTSYIEMRYYDTTYYGDAQTCSPRTVRLQGFRERTVSCPAELPWSSTDKACVKHDIARISTKPQPCSTCDLQHNPVNVSTGDKYQTESDISLPWFTLSRHYHSAYSVPEGRLGPGWSHDLNVRLYLNGSSGAGVLMPRGEIVPFRYMWGDYEATDGSGRKVRIVGNVYQLEEGSRTVKFDPQGKATRIDYRSGENLVLQYDTNARLSAVTHSNGRRLTFEYDTNPYPANARLMAIKSDGVALVSYDYDGAGRLEYARYPNGTTRCYHYEDAVYPHHLTGITDENGTRFATFGYNTDGLATLSEHAGGLYHGTFAYQPDGSTVYTDANGRTQAFAFSTDGAYRKITQATDTSGVESTMYALASADFRRRPISRTDKRGIQTTYSYADITDAVQGAMRRITTHQAVGTSQASTSQTDWLLPSLLPAERRTYNAAGTLVRKETWTYNARGQIQTHAVVEP